MLLLQCIRRRYPDAFYTMGNECKQTQTEKKLKKPNRPDTQEMCTQEFIRRAKTYIEMPELKQELLQTFIRRIAMYKRLRSTSKRQRSHLSSIMRSRSQARWHPAIKFHTPHDQNCYRFSAQNITQGVLVGFEQVRRFPNVYGLRRKFNLDSFPAKRRRILSLCIITTNNAASKENPETNIPGSA